MCSMDVHKAFVLVLFITIGISVIQTQKHLSWFQDYGGVYCSSETAVYDKVSSELVCARQCYQRPGCMGFFYNTVTNNCITVTNVSVPENGCQNLNGSIYYSLLGHACSNHLVSGVEDNQLTESSHWCKVFDCPRLYMYNASANSTSARFARLNSTGLLTGAWVAASNSISQYVQVDFQHEKTISGIALQGRDPIENPTIIQYVTKFKVLLSTDCTVFNAIVNDTGADLIFDGNSDPETIVIRYLPERSIARCVRINPVQWHYWNSLRFDVLGC